MRYKDDLRAFGLADGDQVDLVSVYADGERRAPGFRAVPNTKSIVIRLEPAPASG
ncbi:hypothetical protein GCM10009838_62370 [Catenulispora subtropica]|uniref:Uncharacterized protein n=2 Tax=Catenulispora subtropica TaxID=450798 RepID=A0ABN2SQN4_9ACTN